MRGAGHAPLRLPPAPPHTPGEFLPLGASLSCGDRPGPQACMATLLAPPRLSTRGPATLTKPSHRLPSPPGTGSGIARAPPRWSCSAPAGRTWASPETSSSGGRGARRWPSGGLLPAAARSPLSLPLARPSSARLAGPCCPSRPRSSGRCDPRRAAPLRRGGSDEPRESAGAGTAARGCSRRGPPAAAARADTAQHPLAPERPLGLLWPRSSRQRPGASRGSLARTDPGDSPRPAEILPNMEPARGGGGSREGGSSREKRNPVGAPRQELGDWAPPGRGGGGGRSACHARLFVVGLANAWRHGEKPLTVTASGRGGSQKIFELQATCSLELAISKKP